MPIGAGTKASSVRLRQAAIFAVGALGMLLFLGNAVDFTWTPLALGVVYLVAAGAGGRTGGHWGSACVLIGWGIAVALDFQTTISYGPAPLYLAGVGLGGIAAALLARAGFSTDMFGVTATIALAGVFLGASDNVGVLLEGWTYAALLAIVAVVNLALGLRER